MEDRKECGEGALHGEPGLGAEPQGHGCQGVAWLCSLCVCVIGLSKNWLSCRASQLAEPLASAQDNRNQDCRL